MRVLVVKKKDSCWPFVEEQTSALAKIGIESVYHLIEGKGMMAYVKDIVKLVRDIRRVQPDVIHAHYGLSGFYTCMVVRLMRLAHKLPVVITYHGSDINNPKVRKLSQGAIRMAAFNIFVSPKMKDMVSVEENSAVIPCGIDWDDWPDISREEARKQMGLEQGKKYVLFCSDFQTEVKNPKLAKEAISKLNGVELIELKGYTRVEVNKLMHAVDVCLMTSKTEGSPQFIKEAMACGCPIVSTHVGDTEYVIGNTEGCYFTDNNVEDCAKQLMSALYFAEMRNRSTGRQRMEKLGYSNDLVAQKIKAIYAELIKTRK